VLYARVAGEPFVYGVGAGIAKQAQADALNYRERTVFELPEMASLKALRLSKLSDDTVLLDLRAEAAETSLSAAAGRLSDQQRSAANSLIDLVKKIEAKAFLYGRREAPDASPWAYKLSIEQVPEGGTADQVVATDVLITERLGGTRQIAGMNEPALTFFLTQPWIDALSPLIQPIEVQRPQLPETAEPLPGNAQSAPAPKPPMPLTPAEQSPAEAPLQQQAPGPQDTPPSQ
jgi:hypothetical protein